LLESLDGRLSDPDKFLAEPKERQFASIDQVTDVAFRTLPTNSKRSRSEGHRILHGAL
jgi:hypothetical protein